MDDIYDKAKIFANELFGRMSTGLTIVEKISAEIFKKIGVIITDLTNSFLK